MDSVLRQMVSNRLDNLSYYSFINGSSEQRKQALVYNRMQSVKMKYEIIKNANSKEIVRANGVEMTFRKALAEVIVNKEIIFQAIEQGYGTRSNDLFVYYHPEHKKLVSQWFQDDFMKGIVLKNSRVLETSIAKQNQEQRQYSEHVDQLLSKSIAIKQSTLEALSVYQSTVSYASIVKGLKTQ